jgi:hypothetical protein
MNDKNFFGAVQEWSLCWSSFDALYGQVCSV